MVLKHSEMVPLGSEAHGFSLRGVDSRMYTLESFDGCDVLVVVFMCNHCPYVQACIDRLCRLAEGFRERGVGFVGINANDHPEYPEDNFEAMKGQAEEWGMNFPYLFDEGQRVARAYGAVCTPDIFVYEREKESKVSGRRLVYRGRLDDNWKEFEEVKEESLRFALEDILEGREISVEQKPSMGCSIKWQK